MTPPPIHGASAAAELELADRARQGDHSALETLYLRHREALFRHAMRMLGNEAEAKDVVQESFARAIEALDRTRPQLRFKAWIFRIATNLCLRLLTREGRRFTPREDLDHLQSTSEESDPRDRHRRGEIGRMVAHAMSRLPDNYRQILLLREVEELSYEELALALEMSLGNVKVTLHRARTSLAAAFIADRLADEPPSADAVGCPQLAELVQQAEHRDPIERHLRGCAACRQQQRPTADLLALLPPVALPTTWPVPPAPNAAGAVGAKGAAGASSTSSTSSGAGATGAAGTVGATGASPLIIGVVIGAVILGIGAAAGAFLLHRASSVDRTAAVEEAEASAAAPATGSMNRGGMRGGTRGGTRGGVGSDAVDPTADPSNDPAAGPAAGSAGPEGKHPKGINPKGIHPKGLQQRSLHPGQARHRVEGRTEKAARRTHHERRRRPSSKATGDRQMIDDEDPPKARPLP